MKKPRPRGVESHLPTDSGLLQKKVLNAGTLDHPAGVEVDVNVLSEAAGVVVADGLGIAKGCGWKGQKGDHFHLFRGPLGLRGGGGEVWSLGFKDQQ